MSISRNRYDAETNSMLALTSRSPLIMTSLVNRCSLIDRLNRRLQTMASSLRTYAAIGQEDHLHKERPIPGRMTVSKEDLEWLVRYRTIRHLRIVLGDAPRNDISRILLAVPRVVRCRLEAISIVDDKTNPIRDELIHSFESVLELCPRARDVRMSNTSMYPHSDICYYNPYSDTDILDMMGCVSVVEHCSSSELAALDPIVKIANTTLDTDVVSNGRIDSLCIARDFRNYSQRDLTINCSSLTLLQTESHSISNLFCPNLLLMNVNKLSDSIECVQLHRLVTLYVGEISCSLLHKLKDIAPSLKSLVVYDLIGSCFITSELPSSLTRLAIDNPEQDVRILFDGSLHLTDLELECCGISGTLPSTLVNLRVYTLALCEIAHCYHLKSLSYVQIRDETEWPSSLTSLTVSVKNYRLPSTLPIGLKELRVYDNGTPAIDFYYSVDTLDVLDVQVELNPTQLRQFRGHTLRCRNKKQDLDGLRTDNERRIVRITQ